MPVHPSRCPMPTSPRRRPASRALPPLPVAIVRRTRRPGPDRHDPPEAISRRPPAHAHLFRAPGPARRTARSSPRPSTAPTSATTATQRRLPGLRRMREARHRRHRDRRRQPWPGRGRPRALMRALTSPAELRGRSTSSTRSTCSARSLQRAAEDDGGAARPRRLHPGHHRHHKVPATIISRTQRPTFAGSPTTNRREADRIVAAEGAEAEPEALALIARLADGGCATPSRCSTRCWPTQATGLPRARARRRGLRR